MLALPDQQLSPVAVTGVIAATRCDGTPLPRRAPPPSSSTIAAHHRQGRSRTQRWQISPLLEGVTAGSAALAVHRHHPPSRRPQPHLRAVDPALSRAPPAVAPLPSTCRRTQWPASSSASPPTAPHADLEEERSENTRRGEERNIKREREERGEKF